MRKISVKSPAKVNLTLDVFPKKAGEKFHQIKTIYHKISLCDEVKISEADTFEIVGDFDFPMKQNLIFKAWKLIEEFVLPENFYPVKIKIKKNIPMGGGLGGGSSNFANFVKGYFKLFKLGEIPQSLIDKSGEIGKDIPFFFSDSRCKIGTNFGEIISNIPFNHDKFKNTPIYIYQPPFQSSTPEMFQKLENFNTNFTDEFLKTSNLDNCGNAFDQFLLEKKYKILSTASKVTLSGSGSCFFSFKQLDIKNCQVIETNL